MRNVAEAMRYARQLLEPMESRWMHVQAVAKRAEELSSTIQELSLAIPELSSTIQKDETDGDVLVASAWLYDIGYAPDLAITGFHHLDGANHLEGLGEHRLACLVAHHSSGAEEGHLREYDKVMRRFQRESGLIADCLTYCDLSTGPDGTWVSLDDRITEVEARYGADRIVPRGLRLAYPQLVNSFERVNHLLAKR